ncbi:hypothetical protein [Anianabacter salinae]|uniref:hypothetical protein n=1 Tax=Anianabacter salinae TaxID=2851023 RepID=UPI00225E0AC3|nr:hypothetical protein [Anianabacter salinae]MBV0911698.1 hypothetical protein [Anianabacter salinae]
MSAAQSDQRIAADIAYVGEQRGVDPMATRPGGRAPAAPSHKTLPPALRKAAAEALAAYKASAEYAALQAKLPTMNLLELQSHLAHALNGPHFAPLLETSRTMSLDVDLEGLIPKAVSLGVSGQVVFGIGVSGSVGYIVDLNVSDFASAIYVGGAVDVGADGGIQGDACVGFWTNTIEDMSGWYVGEEIDIDDALGVMEATYLKDEELALAFVGVTLGFDDGFENSNYYFNNIALGHAPIYQSGEFSHMVQLNSLSCENSKDNWDTCYIEFYSDGDSSTLYRYPAWDGYQLSESQRDDAITSWGVGEIIKFNSNFSIKLHVGDHTMPTKTVSLSSFNGQYSTTSVTFDDKIDVVNEIKYSLGIELLKA